MKKTGIQSIILILSIFVLCTGCPSPSQETSVTGVTLDKTDVTLEKDATLQLQATITPADATNQHVTWASSEESVARVSSSGLVTAIAAGSADITVTTEDGSKTASCKIIVQEQTISVTSVTLDKTTATLDINETMQLSATISPSNATNKNVTWASSNTSVATVSSTGWVTAKTAGLADITVTTKDGSKTATCSVTVKGISIVFEGPADENIDLTTDDSTELSKSDYDSITITVSGAWDSYEWYVDGNQWYSSDSSYSYFQ